MQLFDELQRAAPQAPKPTVSSHPVAAAPAQAFLDFSLSRSLREQSIVQSQDSDERSFSVSRSFHSSNLPKIYNSSGVADGEASLSGLDQTILSRRDEKLRQKQMGRVRQHDVTRCVPSLNRQMPHVLHRVQHAAKYRDDPSQSVSLENDSLNGSLARRKDTPSIASSLGCRTNPKQDFLSKLVPKVTKATSESGAELSNNSVTNSKRQESLAQMPIKRLAPSQYSLVWNFARPVPARLVPNRSLVCRPLTEGDNSSRHDKSTSSSRAPY